MHFVCVCFLRARDSSVLLLCALRAVKEFMLFRPSSLPRLLAILGKCKLQSFSMWLACVVPNLFQPTPTALSLSLWLPPLLPLSLPLSIPSPAQTIPMSLFCLAAPLIAPSHRIVSRRRSGSFMTSR